MRVLVIPEDFRKDQYILKPIIKALMEACGKPQAIVRVCQDPLLGGVRSALDSTLIREIVDRYQGMVDLFILVVDRDGVAGRSQRLRQLEAEAGEALKGRSVLLAENAWQEIEVWVLAGQDDLPAEWLWSEIRSEPNAKEAYFEPYARSRQLADGPGGGRKFLAERAAKRFGRIRQLCAEDVEALRSAVERFLHSGE